MGAALPGLVRNALASLAVVGAVAVISVGFPLLDQSMPAGRAVVANVPYQVGGKVTVVPPPGASLDLTRTRPGGDRGTALFVIDGVRLALVASPYHDSLPEAASRLHLKITNTTGFQVTGADQGIQTAQGVSGLRGGYSSPGRLGEYAVFVAHGMSVEVTASGPEDRLRLVLPVLEQSLRSLTFGDDS